MASQRILGAAAVSAGAALALSVLAVSPAHAVVAPEYAKATGTGVTVTPIALSGDTIGAGYTIAGVPDGIGAFKNADGTLTVLLNHELSLTSVAKDLVHPWGGGGSFISKLTFDPATNTLTAGEELIKKINWWNYATDTYGTTPVAPQGARVFDSYGTPNHTLGLNRFCASHFMPAGSLQATTRVKIGKKWVTKQVGYDGGVYFTAEEGSDESRAFAVDMNGEAFQLPRLGLGGFENILVAPASATGKTTVAFTNEDGSATDSQLFMYVGQKTDVGSFADKVGLTNGANYTMAILDDTGNPLANDVAFRKLGKGKVSPVVFNKVAWDQSGAAQQGAASRVGTTLARVEDGEWDVNNPSVYYFITTESAGAAITPTPGMSWKRDGGALWKLTLKDIKNPLAGGTIEMLLDGLENAYLNKPDNLTVTADGNVLIQEDPGANDQVSRIMAYNLSSKKFAPVAQFNNPLFAVGGVGFMTNDEETSGVTEITSMVAAAGDTARYYLFDAQVHTKPSIARPDLVVGLTPEQITAFDNKVVEGGGLYLLKIANLAGLYTS